MTRLVQVACILIIACAFSGCVNQTVFAPSSIALADINGDGVLDILVATTSDRGFTSDTGFARVIVNTPSQLGTFRTGVAYRATGQDPSSIALGDLTGSGSLDMVVANTSGSVSVFLHGATPGTFQNAVNFVTGGLPTRVVIGDVNGDGRPDLVVSDGSGGGRVMILFADPAHPGSFLPAFNLSTGVYNMSVAIADLNGDGRPDIVAVGADINGNNGSAYVFYQTTTPGTFSAPSVFPAGAQPQSVKVADLNADGHPDLVVANYWIGLDGLGSPGVSVLLQDALHLGQFFAPVTYATGELSVDVAVGDLNGDGKLDLVVANIAPEPTGSVSVLLQDPLHPGAFLAATNYLGIVNPLSVAIGDLNGDGKPDIAVADSTTATVLFQIPAAPGTFAAAVQVGN